MLTVLYPGLLINDSTILTWHCIRHNEVEVRASIWLSTDQRRPYIDLKRELWGVFYGFFGYECPWYQDTPYWYCFDILRGSCLHSPRQRPPFCTAQQTTLVGHSTSPDFPVGWVNLLAWSVLLNRIPSTAQILLQINNCSLLNLVGIFVISRHCIVVLITKAGRRNRTSNMWKYQPDLTLNLEQYKIAG